MRVKKKIILIGAAVVALILLVGAYMKWVSPTKIAFFNYQVITLGEINRANDNHPSAYSRLALTMWMI